MWSEENKIGGTRTEQEQQEMEKIELIFVPLPASSHLIPIVEFGKRLLDQDDQLSITMLLIDTFYIPDVHAYTETLTASHPRIRLVDIPKVEPPPSDFLIKCPDTFFHDHIKSHVPHVKNIVREIMFNPSSDPDPARVAGLVVDFFCSSMVDAANELDLPSYIFLTSNAGYLRLMMHLPDRYEFKSSDLGSQIPGFFNPVPSKVFPSPLFNIYDYATYVNVAKRCGDAKGIIANTFAELEPYALTSFPDDPTTPPVYPIGPMLSLRNQPILGFELDRKEKIMRWLDEQPHSSVVFLCFGTGGSFESTHMKEIALGLEQSGYRFLWAVRVPLSSDVENPEEILPEGFLERSGGRGMVCGWAPQVEVLAHKAIGGFVSHCGWNSILESLWFGVPIVTLPIFAEQQLNAFRMVKELGLAVELKLDSTMNSEPVAAEEVARAVRSVMESASDERGVRKKVEGMSELSRKALMDGGSSVKSMAKLINDIRGE